MNIDTGQASRKGNRDENQDRTAVLISDSLVLLIVADGMGGHADGALAAQTAVDSLSASFKQLRSRKNNASFLADALLTAHRAVYDIGSAQSFARRPRTTCTMCLVDDGTAQWAHIGDSRVYRFHGRRVAARTRDHSEVEALYQAGEISGDDLLTHPRRSFVDKCLGGDPADPGFDISEPIDLAPGDILLLCTDGLWAAASTDTMLEALRTSDSLDHNIENLVEAADAATTPASDNISAAALVWNP